MRGGQGRRHGRGEGSTARRRLEDRPAHRRDSGAGHSESGEREERRKERKGKRGGESMGKKGALVSPREPDAPISRAWPRRLFSFQPVLLSSRGDRNVGVG